MKYDSWHKEVLSKFGSLLSNEMSSFHTNVSKVSLGRSRLKVHKFYFMVKYEPYARSALEWKRWNLFDYDFSLNI